ncbi:MAG: hypothetical protein V7K40_32740 [Nostoc sp.]|uniref:hypothetical protein n=1 Tax=Nostoc sp. TaxID=1180 RepID=UPI002FF563FB
MIKDSLGFSASGDGAIAPYCDTFLSSRLPRHPVFPSLHNLLFHTKRLDPPTEPAARQRDINQR